MTEQGKNETMMAMTVWMEKTPRQWRQRQLSSNEKGGQRHHPSFSCCKIKTNTEKIAEVEKDAKENKTPLLLPLLQQEPQRTPTLRQWQ